MRKLLLPICIVALLILLLSGVIGKGKDREKPAPVETTPAFTTVSEAAFSMRSTGSEEATSFLVGSFAGEHGEELVFDGAGEVKRVTQSLSVAKGTYQLLQSSAGASLLTLSIGGAEKTYTFEIASQDGGFTIRDEDGNAETFLPVE